MSFFKVSWLNRSALSIVSIFIWFVLLEFVSGKSRIETTCQTCRELIKNFNMGMEKTAKNHFGGGDTAWEEENLGSYARSETRLLEILENVCKDVAKESSCHAMVEEHEELLENFWFNKHKELSGLEKFLCIDTLKVCCPIGKYGRDCKECPGGANKPCNGRGTCKGSGTQDGTGECECNSEYTGAECEKCKDNYYREGIECIKCHKSCNSCKGVSNKECEKCGDGYIMDEEKGCIDKDECEVKDICKVGEFCFNTEGSFRCHQCDPACKDGCTGTGRLSCANCSYGWKLIEQTKGCEDINECDQEAICPVGTYCKNSPGSYTCEPCHQACNNGCVAGGAESCRACKEGYRWLDDKGCVDVNECEEKKVTCLSGQVCVNKEGPDSCQACHSSCFECSSTSKDGCLICKIGFTFTNGQCNDINECTDNPCNSKTETCINNVGSYKCKCKSGFARSKNGLCFEKKKGKTEMEMEDSLIEKDLLEGNYLTEKQMKLGSLIYGLFFICLVILFKFRKYYVLTGFVLIYALIIAWTNSMAIGGTTKVDKID